MPSRKQTSRARATRKDKQQDKQIQQLRRLVVGQKELNEAKYEANLQTLPASGTIINLVNYDNEINYISSPIVSRTFFRLSSNLLVRGDQSGSTAVNSSRPIRVIYFMYHCDVVSGVTVPYNVVAPTMDDMFDDLGIINDCQAIARISYKNRDRIKVLKDFKTMLTNHTNQSKDTKLFSFNKNYKYGLNIKRYTSDDSAGAKRCWMPYVLILDALSNNPLLNNLIYSIVNQPLYTEELN